MQDLADLKRCHSTFYRHAGPSGPEEMCRSPKGASSWKSSHPGHPASDSRTPPETSLKGWKSLMSIALADLEKRRTRFSIDMQVLADLKRCHSSFHRHSGPGRPEEMCRSTKGFSFWKSSQLGHPASDSRTPPETSLKGWKSLMSIALADLERRRAFFYRHAGPSGSEEMCRSPKGASSRKSAQLGHPALAM